MIVWINGAFGSGKTQAAWELHKRIPGSYVYDPENVGYFIRRTSPAELNGGDFQDLPEWRSINFELLLRLSREYRGIIIAPMTIVRPDYYHEIITRLRQNGAEVRHCALIASPETLRKRLKGRLERNDAWSVKQIARCVKGLQNPLFENKIDTNHLKIDTVVEEIAYILGVRIIPDSRNGFIRWLGRIHNQIRVMRII